MLILQGVTYVHPNRDILFTDINLTIRKQDKVALIGNNGAGKSTLLNILAGNLQPYSGLVITAARPYCVPQIFGQFNDYTVAQVLGVTDKIKALADILEGNVTEAAFALLEDDWAIEERCKEAFAHWKLDDLDLAQKMATLSGGQKTKVFLAGILIHRPQMVLLDEPSNHLDTQGRNILYNYINNTTNTIVAVSHDRTLLNLFNSVCELGKHGITVYGGNYDFYAEQKAVESDALIHNVKAKEKALRKAKETERTSLERQQKLDARGKKKQEKAGLPTISMNTFRNNAEKSTARLKDVHAEKIADTLQELNQLRTALPGMDKMKMDIYNAVLHKGKVLVTAKDVNISYEDRLLWKQALNFEIRSGERIAIRGSNGAGKTSLIKMITGILPLRTGTISRATFKAVYIDQDYSLINNNHSVYEQVQQFNTGGLQEHEIKIRLNRFLFTKEYWNKSCRNLSGGEKMRLMLCLLTISNQAPDMIILDEPTNNLDMQNIEILTGAINQYHGTVLVISHDEYFVKQVNADRSIILEQL